MSEKMTRQNAIDGLVGAWMQRDMELCAGAAEAPESEAEMREALHALGVTDAEIDDEDD